MVRKRDLDAIAGEGSYSDASRAAGCRGFPFARNRTERCDPRAPLEHAFRVQKARGELLVVAGRAHRHDQRLAVEPDFERLLDGDQILIEHLSPAPDGDGAERRRVRDVGRHASIIVPVGVASMW